MIAYTHNAFHQNDLMNFYCCTKTRKFVNTAANCLLFSVCDSLLLSRCCCWVVTRPIEIEWEKRTMFSPDFLSCVSVSDRQTTTVGFPNRTTTNGYMPISNSIGLLFWPCVCVYVCSWIGHFVGHRHFFLQCSMFLISLFVCLFSILHRSMFMKFQIVSDCFNGVGAMKWIVCNKFGLMFDLILLLHKIKNQFKRSVSNHTMKYTVFSLFSLHMWIERFKNPPFYIQLTNQSAITFSTFKFFHFHWEIVCSSSNTLALKSDEQFARKFNLKITST